MHIMKNTAVAAMLPAFVLMPAFATSSGSAQDVSPTMTQSCEMVAASPMAGMEGMTLGTPMAGDEHDMAGMTVEFDQLYIDMMLPHHASIIALAQAAQDRLTDERLQVIAGNIITSQSAENEELRGYREAWYGSAEPMPMHGAMMGMMTEMMPGMGDMESMHMQMDPRALVAAFCAEENADLAFIELTIPHHEMAIRASEAALDQATHDELRGVAERVITDQQREIEELEQIAADLAGEATPASS